MIDLTPLDVRKKKGDFNRTLRGYDPARVDEFLDLASERMEELVRENLALAARVESLSESIQDFRERERALNDALVSAQQIREDMREQARREADLVLREARAEGERILEDARRQVMSSAEALRRIQGQRTRFLRLFRALVERQLAEIEQEEDRIRELPRQVGDGRGEIRGAVGVPASSAPAAQAEAPTAEEVPPASAPAGEPVGDEPGSPTIEAPGDTEAPETASFPAAEESDDTMEAPEMPFSPPAGERVNAPAAEG
ncbi:MAG TPA: DivIVA domain-containing protein [Longimicrobiaceae bacterium]|nr:DivIVA domain-containing protein [Longimicrobiaceae bacterium]